MKPLSRITETFTESVIREMTRICTEENALNLSQGLPEFEPPEEVQEAAIQAIRDGLNQYPVTFGEPELRDAISKKARSFNGIRSEPETDVTVTCGATEAMMATLRALINPGDELVVLEPYYENYGPDGILSGATPRYVRLRPPEWTWDPEELKKAFTKKTKAIVINNPNNPTGRVFTAAELRLVRDLCVDHDVYAVTDEIYEHIVYDGRRHISLAALPSMQDRTVTINALSKTYNVTGWRVGWAIAEQRITQRIRKVHDFLTVGAPTPFQHAGVVALGMPGSYYEELAKKYIERRDFLHEVITSAGFRASKPEGAYYLMADASAPMNVLGSKEDNGFTRDLIKKVGVGVVPGSSFLSRRVDGKNLVRFTFCKKWETLKRAKEIFEGSVLRTAAASPKPRPPR